jgi:hypothetical protein
MRITIPSLILSLSAAAGCGAPLANRGLNDEAKWVES